MFLSKLSTEKIRLKTALIAGILMLSAVLLSLTSLIPSGYMKIDVTKNKIYTLGETSVSIAKETDTEITLYLISDEPSQNKTLRTIMERYKKVNSKISVKRADPEEDAALIKKYYSGTPEANSILVVSEKRGRYIPYSAIFYYSNDAYSAAYQYYSYYTQLGYLESGYTFSQFMDDYAQLLSLYDGYTYELQLTSAIRYVSIDNPCTVYMLIGHNESGVTKDISNRMSLELFNCKTLNLSTTDLPEDADCLLLMPYSDITEKEYGILSNYLSNGGKITLLTSYSSSTEFKNLLKLTGEFGLSTSFDRYLCEDDENYNLNGYQGLIIPDISDSIMADELSETKGSVLLGGSTGITAKETEGITVTPILTTSPQAYEKKIEENSSSLEFKEETDTRGSYYVGVKAENSSGGSLMWISSPALTYDDYDPYTGRGNKTAFVHLMKSMTENQGAPDVPPTLSVDGFISVDAAYIYTFLGIFALLAIGALVFGIIKYKRN